MIPAPLRAAILALGLVRARRLRGALLARHRLAQPRHLRADAGGHRRARRASAPGASCRSTCRPPRAAISTDRILIKPGALRVAYLPDGRWVDPAPEHVQSLLVRSLAGTGRFGFVGGESSGPLPDYVLISDLEAFQAELAPAGATPPVTVVVRLTVTILRDLDRRVVATQSFEGRAGAAGDDAPTVVTAFDAAMGQVLRDATSWTSAVATGGAGT